jgi:hypothetical protein
VGHPLLDEVKNPTRHFGQPGKSCDERVELIAMQDQKPDLTVIEDRFIVDLDPDDVADDVGRSVVVAAYPDQVEIVSVRIAADDFQAGEMTLGQPCEVQIVENVAIHDQSIAVLDCPGQELFQQFGLADINPQVQIADHDAVIKGTVQGGGRWGE